MVYNVIGEPRTAWAGKTWEEVRETGERNGSIVVLPIGTIEQHGRHMPVATDTILVDAVATAGAERAAGDVPILVTPPLWCGFSHHHLPFGGTLTIDQDELVEVLDDLVESALDNKFDAVLILNGHGGNMAALGTAVSRIGMSHPEAEVTGLSYFSLAESFIDEIRDSQPGGMGHAGEFETSLMLHLRPDLVHEDKVEGTPLDDPYSLARKDMFKAGPLAVLRTHDEYSKSGAIGVPEAADAEKGERIYEGIADELATLLRELHAQNS